MFFVCFPVHLQSAAQAAAQAAAAMAEFGKKKKKEKANAVKPSTGAQGTSMTAIRIGGLGAEIAKWKGQQARLGPLIACCACNLTFVEIWSLGTSSPVLFS